MASDACNIYCTCTQVTGSPLVLTQPNVIRVQVDTSDPPTPFQSQSTSVTSRTAAGNSVTTSIAAQLFNSSKSNGKHFLFLTLLTYLTIILCCIYIYRNDCATSVDICNLDTYVF